MNKLLVICGPTATGKTSLGVYLAKKFGGEIVSADSRQVFEGMDIATGKDLPVNSKFQIPNSKFRELNLGYYLFEGIPVWMLDVIRPDQEFSVAQYIELAWKVIFDIWDRKKLPILIGGTGFYIKGLIDGIETLGVPPDWELRRKLESLSVGELLEMLVRFDPGKAASMNVSDRKNPRRLIRAIEVAVSNRNLATQKVQKRMNILFIGLRASYEELYQRIDRRIDKQFKTGIESEIKDLLYKGYSFVYSALGVTIGYREWQSFFEGKATKEEVLKKWKFDEHGYARRQMTWFKKDKRIIWFDITKQGWENRVEKNISSWYTGKQDAKKN